MSFKKSAEVAKAWKEWRAAFRSGEERLAFHWLDNTAIPATFGLLAIPSWAPYPVGFVYYRPILKRSWELLYFSVIDQLRGAGIGKQLHDEFLRGARFNRVDAIYTQSIATANAEAILKAAGYRRQNDGYWLELAAK